MNERFDCYGLHSLWYENPATIFEEALPVGAGRFGAMVFGDPHNELLKLNEDSVWSGGKRSRRNPNALEGFHAVRKMLLEGKIADAEKVAFEKMQGCPPNSRHYMPLGNLSLCQHLPEGKVTNYRRSLDVTTAIQKTVFTIGDALYTRSIFCSAPAQVMVIHLQAENGAKITCDLSLDGRDDYYDGNYVKQTDNGAVLCYTGSMGGKDGIHFAVAVQATATDGVVTSYGNTLRIENAVNATVVLGVRTNYYHPDADLLAMAQSDTAFALSHSYIALKKDHLADYGALYDRCDISLGAEDKTAKLIPTDALLDAVKSGDLTHRNALIGLYFRYGRYLMIAASRVGSLPMNLQGIWNQDMWPAWGSRFTININTEMNYWPAEQCALQECHLPLFDLIERMRLDGRLTAKEMYACDGFCAHHNTDLWGDCAPQDLWMPATLWPMGAAWLCLHIYEHYCFSGDVDFLREKYPTLREAAVFFTDFLMPMPDGQLVTCPSVSPENTYRLPNGEKGNLSIAPSMDTQIIAALFDAVIASAAILDTDHAFAEKCTQMRGKLPKPAIGKHGQIMEWAEDYDEEEPGHRHISQLFALHPAHMITPEHTPELARAADATLTRRLSHGGGHTGWSRAWIANMYARLQNSEAVLSHMTQLMQHSTASNLFDMHPPFQIDGNFGGTAAIAESLMQSNADGIRLLPACPDAWSEGAFYGMRAYGGFTVSAKWHNGTLCAAQVLSENGNICKITLPNHAIVTTIGGSKIDTINEADGTTVFATQPHSTYLVVME